MGVSKHVGFNKFPKQGILLGAPVEVIFNYNTKESILGRIIRDDMSEPWHAIIQLEDGRVILSNECQFSLIKKV